MAGHKTPILLIIQHFFQSFTVHFINAHFVGAAETVLGGAQQAVDVVAVAFKLQDRVHHMLQDLRPRQTSLFGNMPDHKYRHIGFLRKAQELRSAFAHLAYTSGAAVDIAAAAARC
ncbi:UNKNOWN [Stylonychia lemnae]|uniref:Uncharacterized protein n=1 Tax=Stylonychia lemnae TaxID=5949 RepID=A0A077ZQF1_STYLE|nr:UNKNOWN [Stylonychia lemnae]|eukprot:CDW71625.1 UNKNOWN [Stylonychia lemnae]